MNLNDVLFHISIDLLWLNLSPIFEFSLKAVYPPWLGKIFKFRVFWFMHLWNKKIVSRCFCSCPAQTKLCPSFLPSPPGKGKLSPRQQFFKNLPHSTTSKGGGNIKRSPLFLSTTSNYAQTFTFTTCFEVLKLSANVAIFLFFFYSLVFVNLVFLFSFHLRNTLLFFSKGFLFYIFLPKFFVVL